MSDTPKTDAACFAVVSNDPQSTVVWADFARQLERENAALREENSKLKKVIHDQGDEIRMRCIFSDAAIEALDAYNIDMTRPGGVLARHTQEAVVAARAKEVKTCQCTNGVVRSVGRDNEEIIEDCPNCSPSKETKP